MEGWRITGVSPAGGSIGGDTLLTLTGVNLHLLHQAEFRPKFEVRNFQKNSFFANNDVFSVHLVVQIKDFWDLTIL